MHYDSAVAAEWQQNMSIPFFCGPASRLETWATLLCRLCCLHEDKFVGILSVHFNQRPSLVKATHGMEMDSHGGLEVTIRQTESKKKLPNNFVKQTPECS